MIVNEKKFKVYSAFFGVLFLVIISISFYYIYNIKNIKITCFLNIFWHVNIFFHN